MPFIRDGELAIAQRVPELDGAVARARHDLPVVGREGDGEDVVGVPDEAARRGARGEFPQPEGLVPGGGEGVGAVGGDDLVGWGGISDGISDGICVLGGMVLG